MTRATVSVILLFLAVQSVSWACWNDIDPGAFAFDCPVIVTGTIESVAEAAPGGTRSDDVARIRVTAIHRNELTDLALKTGDLLPVKMISRNNNQRTSTDLNYPVKTQAVWLILLTSKGEFRIDAHPVQKQPVQAKPKLRLEQRDRAETKLGEKPARLANPAGTKSRAEWIEWRQNEEARRVRSLLALKAREKAIRELAQAFADADRLDETIWKRYQEADVEVRRDIFQLQLHEQPMTGPRLAEVAKGALTREKNDNIRTHAVSRLAYCRDPGVMGMEVLAGALSDKSARVRLFACQSVKMRRYIALTEQVKSLQNDPDAEVREMATQTLEFWRAK